MNTLLAKKVFIIFAFIILLINVFLISGYFKLNLELRNIDYQKKILTQNEKP